MKLVDLAVPVDGINAYSSDTSTATAAAHAWGTVKFWHAVEEERFTRIKHSAGFPAQGIRYCAQASGKGADKIEPDISQMESSASMIATCWDSGDYTCDHSLPHGPNVVNCASNHSIQNAPFSLTGSFSHDFERRPTLSIAI